MKITGSIEYRWLKGESPPSQFVELHNAHLSGAVVQWHPDRDSHTIRLAQGATIPMFVTAVSTSIHLDYGYLSATVELTSADTGLSVPK